MDYLLSPILLIGRLTVAGLLYYNLIDEIKTVNLDDNTVRHRPLMVFFEIRNQDILMVCFLGISHGLVASRHMAKKPSKSDVFTRHQNKAGHLRSMARHFGLVVGLLISTCFIFYYYD
jgi:hypothetical protein